MIQPEWSLVRLTPDSIIKPFHCADDDLDDFFSNHCIQYLSSLLAVTYTIESDNQTIAFFSMLNDKIDVHTSQRTKNWWKTHPGKWLHHTKRFESYPAVKLGRLGVHSDHQGQGIGGAIIDYIKNLFVTNNRTGCKFITVDAYNNSRTINFYQKNGFDFLLPTEDISDTTRLMYFDLIQVLNAEPIEDSF